MGGYVCLCTVASAEVWKLGQLCPGATLRFWRVEWDEAVALYGRVEMWMDDLKLGVVVDPFPRRDFRDLRLGKQISGPKLYSSADGDEPRLVLRQAGDSAILVEYGRMTLDLRIRARIQAFEGEFERRNVRGIVRFCPCIRSTLCIYDPKLISQRELVRLILEVDKAVSDGQERMEFRGRRITFPIVLDDDWSKDAIRRYMSTTRDKAVYLPSNVDYLAKNNGFETVDEALRTLVASEWLVLGVGFYLACPFLVPVDPRCRLVGQKMNPSRTYTPRGAIGIAGVVAAIYPIESPGGYQLFGRTLPAWDTWSRNHDFASSRPWLLNVFDQVKFKPVTAADYGLVEKDFDAGRYSFEIEDVVFSGAEYVQFESSLQKEVALFKAKQSKGVAMQESIEKTLYAEWDQAQRKRALVSNKVGMLPMDTNMSMRVISSPLFASIWKIICTPGEVVSSADQVLLILEAMKTEIPIRAGEDAVGYEVKSFGEGVQEGCVAHPGMSLIILGKQ